MDWRCRCPENCCACEKCHLLGELGDPRCIRCGAVDNGLAYLVDAICETCEIEMDADELIRVLRENILEFCRTEDGNLPGESLLRLTLTAARANWSEWTIDTVGPRDWKLDRNRHGISLRYRGDDYAARVATWQCNEMLGWTANSKLIAA